MEVSSVHWPGLQVERPAAHHVGQRRKAAARAKLDGGSHGVAGRQAQQAAAKAVLQVHNFVS
jgi:hypothetical protein